MPSRRTCGRTSDKGGRRLAAVLGTNNKKEPAVVDEVTAPHIRAGKQNLHLQAMMLWYQAAPQHTLTDQLTKAA
jgi:hypothetical protein